MLDTIETERLMGDRLSLDHLDDLYWMHRDPVVIATLAGVRCATLATPICRTYCIA